MSMYVNPVTPAVPAVGASVAVLETGGGDSSQQAAAEVGAHTLSQGSTPLADGSVAGVPVLPNTGNPVDLLLLAVAAALIVGGVLLVSRSRRGSGHVPVVRRRMRLSATVLLVVGGLAATAQLLALSAVPTGWNLVAVVVALFTTLYLGLALHTLTPVGAGRRGVRTA